MSVSKAGSGRKKPSGREGKKPATRRKEIVLDAERIRAAEREVVERTLQNHSGRR